MGEEGEVGEGGRRKEVRNKEREREKRLRGKRVGDAVWASGHK